MGAIQVGKELNDMPIADLRAFSTLIDEDVYLALSLERTLAAKSQPGGTAPTQVARALATARASLKT
jgi:argininosuccinate lyase